VLFIAHCIVLFTMVQMHARCCHMLENLARDADEAWIFKPKM